MKKRRNSTAITKAERRIEGARAIAPDLDLGRGFSVSQYELLVNEVRQKLADYNVARSKVEATQNALEEAERSLNNYSAHFLLSVASYFGKESDEYGLAGGTRKVDRRRLRTVSTPVEPAQEA